MIPTWPYPNPYEEAIQRLDDAITIVKLRDMLNDSTPARRVAAQVSNDHSTNIRDVLAAVIDGSERP